MKAISREAALELLNGTHRRLSQLNLPRHASVEGVPREKGGLLLNAGYVLDSYLPYKAPDRSGVYLGILQARESQPRVCVQRRQTVDGLMTTVGADWYELEDYAVAEQTFLAIAKSLSCHGHEWTSSHPSDRKR